MSILDSTSALLESEIRTFLSDYGLEELAKDAVKWAGLKGSEFQIQFEANAVVQQRFAPVFQRRKEIASGRSTIPLTFADVLSAEEADRQLEQEYGLPTGFIDTFERLNADVSTNEMRQRVQIAVDDAAELYSNPGGRAYLDAVLDNIPGVTEGGIVAYFLDPDNALPQLRNVTEAARVAKGADLADFRVSASEVTRLWEMGVADVNQARIGFESVAAQGQLNQTLRGDAGIGRETQIGLVAGDAEAQAELERVRRRRLAAFGGGGSFAGGTAGLGSAS